MSLEFIKPQLATAVDHPPPRSGWIHEVKHDGYRTLLIIERRKAHAYTRNGFDWTDRYSGIAKAAAKLDCRSAIIDGEVIIQNENGISDFERFKSAIRWNPQRLIFCAFDLLHLNGKDLRDQSLVERRARLKKLIPSEHPFLFSEEFTGDALSGTDRAELAVRLKKLEYCPIPKLRFPDAQWVKPLLKARVRHLLGTGYLRHATVRAFA